MTRTILFITLLMIITFDVVAQDQLTIDGNNYYYESIPPVKLIFLNPMEKPVNSPDPTQHRLLDADWYYDQDRSDEFNDYTLDINKWVVNYKWGNTYLQHLAHNRQDLTNHEFDGNNLKLRNFAGNFSQKMVGYHPNSETEKDGKLNYRSLPYTSAMIMSKNKPKNYLDQPYGFIEMRCKITKSKYVMANFWLWSAGTDVNNKSFYNEIDIFETNDGNIMHQTTHYKMEPDEIWYHHHQIVWTEDASFFSEEMNTYAVKWEPNKVIYYLNNKPVRIITEHIPEHKMDIIVDMAFRAENGSFSELDLSVQNAYTIDYIRVFHRNDYNKPDPIFYINKVISNDFNTPISIDESSPIILNAEESYSIDNAYFISVQEVNNSNQGIGIEVYNWLLNTQLTDINAFDLRIFCQNNGLNLNTNSTYRVKVVAGGGAWIENVQYFRLLPHENLIDFTINASNNSVVNVKNALSYQDLPRIILDGSNSVLSGNDFEIYIEPANSGGGVIGSGISQWYLDQPELLNSFDLRSFAQSKGFDLEYGKYYKVSLCTANPWTCNSKVIYIEPCTNFIDFEINGMKTQLITITSEFNEPDITLITALCNSCFSDDYFISVQNSNINGDALGSEVSEWLIPPNEFSDVASRIDLREFTSSRGLSFVHGNYYLVKVATGNPWTEKSKLLYIDPCISNPDFTIESEYGTIRNPVEIDCEEYPKVRLSAWNGTACDNYYFLSLSICDYDNYLGNCTEIANHWLSTDLVDNMKNTNLTSLAYYNLYDHFQQPPFNTTLSGYNYYKISLCTGFDGWKCKDVYIHMNQPDCVSIEKSSLTDIETSPLVSIKTEVYPNPTSWKIHIKFDPQNSSQKKIVITDVFGKNIYTNYTNNEELIINLSEKATGLYFVKIESQGNVIFKKIIKY